MVNETILHKKLKILGRKIITDKGYEVHQEEGVFVNGKRYRIDLLGISEKGKIAVECYTDGMGITLDENKLKALRSSNIFNEIIILSPIDLVNHLENTISELEEEIERLSLIKEKNYPLKFYDGLLSKAKGVGIK